MDNRKVLASQLHAAAFRGNIEEMRLAIDGGAPIDMEDVNGCTPLHSAVESGLLPCVELLLGLGATVNAVSNSGITPLHLAAESGHVDIVQTLIDKGASLSLSLRERYGRTPLDMAKQWHKRDVQKLIEQVQSRSHENHRL